MQVQTPLLRFVVHWLWIVVQFVFLTGLLTNISTILATLDDNFDVLAACSTTNVASAVAMLHLHTTALIQARIRH